VFRTSATSCEKIERVSWTLQNTCSTAATIRKMHYAFEHRAQAFNCRRTDRCSDGNDGDGDATGGDRETF
jgi:hypothetical protein